MADEANEEGKAKALKYYKIMAVLQGLLGGGMLACGIAAAVNVDEDVFGPPYFVGGFIVGIMALLAAVMCTCVVMKAPAVSGESGDVQKQELRCAVQGHYLLSMFMIMGCFAGTVLAGIGGFGFSRRERSSINEALAPIILVGCIVGMFFTIASLCIICTYGTYFGVAITQGHRGGRALFMTTGNGQFTGVTTNATVFQSDFGNGMSGMGMSGMGMSGMGMSGVGNNSRITELELQNQLLQQQLELQRQLNEQQQQQQQQPQYGGGFAQPPPPQMFNTGPAYPPFAPPPSYDDVKQ